MRSLRSSDIVVCFSDSQGKLLRWLLVCFAAPVRLVFLVKLNIVSCSIQHRSFKFPSPYQISEITLVHTEWHVRLTVRFVAAENTGHWTGCNHLFETLDLRLQVLNVLVHATVITCTRWVSAWGQHHLCIIGSLCLVEHQIACSSERLQIGISTVLRKCSRKELKRWVFKL
jgi:hypothetical protein